MKTIKLTSFLLFSLLVLTACSEKIYFETRAKMPLFDMPVCGDMTPVKFGQTVVLGSDANVTIDALDMAGNTFVFLPVPMSKMIFDELYIGERFKVENVINCIEKLKGVIYDYQVLISDNNSKVRKKDD